MLGNGFGHALRMNSAIFRETGTFRDQVRRPMISNVNENHINHIANVSKGGTSFTPGILAGISGQILMPSTVPESNIFIPGGWGSSRFRVMMEILVSESSLARVRKVLVGYTDILDIDAAAQMISPNTVIYINNIITLRDTWTNGELYTTVQSNDQLLNGVWDAGSAQPAREILIRPEDVVRGMGTPALINKFSELGIQQTNNWGSTFVNGGLLNNRINNSPASYLSSVINAGIQANDMLAADMAGGVVNMDQIALGAGGLLMENTIYNDPVLRNLTEMAHSFTTTGGITVGELQAIFPNFSAISRIFPAKQSDFTKIITSADSESWTSVTQEAIIGSRLAQVIPAIMFETLIARSRFVFTNMTVGGMASITAIEDGTTTSMVEMSNSALQQGFTHMARRICHEVDPAISDNGHMPYHIDIYCDPMSDIRMNIQISNIAVPFTAPCFCDHLTSQVVTNNQFALPKMANDFSTLLNTITLMVEDSKNPSPLTFMGNTGLF